MDHDVTDSTLLGERVFYRLTAADAEKVNRLRTDGDSIRERMAQGQWPAGAQVHIGEHVSEGQLLPMIVTALHDERTPGFSDTIGGQVFLDGNDTFWVRRCGNGDQPGQWSWTRP